jgi:nitroreductase
MEFEEVLRSRRSVRSFRDTPVDSTVVHRLIEAATLAPSANNIQPWEFWVIEGKERVDDLSQRAKLWLTERVAHNPTADAVHQRQQLVDPKFVLFHGAPTLVLVVATSYEKQAEEDCCLAALSFMLAARNEEIGTCWIGSSLPWLNLHSIKVELDIPLGSCIVAPIIVGYPQEWPQSHERSQALIHWV